MTSVPYSDRTYLSMGHHPKVVAMKMHEVTSTDST